MLTASQDKMDEPEVGHVEDGLLVGAKEVEKLLNTGNKHLSSYWNPIYEAQNTECWGTRGVPEEVEVGPLEVLIVKGKGEDGAEIVVGLRQDNLF